MKYLDETMKLEYQRRKLINNDSHNRFPELGKHAIKTVQCNKKLEGPQSLNIINMYTYLSFMRKGISEIRYLSFSIVLDKIMKKRG